MPVRDRIKSISAASLPLPSPGDLTLADRHTDELIIGLVGPVGSGVTTTAKILQTLLKEKFAYDTSYIRVSALIEEIAPLVAEALPDKPKPADRTAKLQSVGSLLRQRFGEAYIAERCIEQIATHRLDKGGYEKVGEELVAKPRRHVHIVDSLKNPAEVKQFRDVYGDAFWLFGIFAPEEIRKERLTSLGIDNNKLQEIMSVDEEEGLPYGQRVRDTIHQSDFFIRNDAENDERLRRVLDRHLSILFNIGVNTPTQDENGMYKAMAAASASACLSRQVGAAIYSASGELIGVGANDVPKMGGGIYSEEEGDNDNRCYKWGGKICHNDDRKQRLYAAITDELRSAKIISDHISNTRVEDALRKTDIRNLIEYSRAVHAEQEAIVSVARGQKAGILGSTMYSTTFPCHSCAALVVVSGISRVIYIEPYEKSLALALHRDAISVRERDITTHVLFLQYEGVAPKNIIRLFNHGIPRKANGRLLERDPRVATLVFQSPLDGFHRREQIIVNRVARAEGPAANAAEGGDGKSGGAAAAASFALADPSPSA
jgi:deoxycytidylate deaminase